MTLRTCGSCGATTGVNYFTPSQSSSACTTYWCGPCAQRVQCHPPAKRPESYSKNKAKVLAHYGNGSPKCSCCQEARLAFLRVGYTNEQNIRGKVPSYDWLVRNHYPTGFAVFCMNCYTAFETQGWCPHNPPAPTLPKPTYCGQTVVHPCTEVVDLYDVVYMTQTGQVDRAVSTDPLKSLVIGIVVRKHNATCAVILLDGEISWPESTLVPGTKYFLGAEPGKITPEPSGEQTIHQIGVGVGLKKLYFTPTRLPIV